MAEATNSDQTVDQDEETSGEKTETLDKWLCALKEDLASWISRLLKIEITVDTFTSALETGVVPCRLANFIQNTGEQFLTSNPDYNCLLPRTGVTFMQKGALRGSFIARDNVCNFIRWCRDVGVPDIIMFETEDLVSNKNDKAVLLTLLEVARRVFKFGVDPPELVRLENEIDKELQNEPEVEPEKPEPVTVLRKRHKSHSLDDLVFEVQQKCTCSTKYPVQRIADGKYRMGDTKNLIFVRVMRKHVMVRVGGGWDTLDRYFEKHDPCRFVGHRRPSRASRSSSVSQPTESFARSPSSVSMASMSSSESYESTGTTSSSQQISGRRSHSPRNRTISGGTTSPTYDRCLSPRRVGSHTRHKSPCNRTTPPRTKETQGRLPSKSRSMQDLAQRRGSEPVGIGSTIPVTKRRPSSACRSSTSPAKQDSRSTSGTPAQRRGSVAVTPRRDAGSLNNSAKKQPVSRGNTQGTSATRMHHRSKSMQELNHVPPLSVGNTPTSSPRKSRPSSSKTRPSSATPDRSDRSRPQGSRNTAPNTRRASMSVVSPRKHSNSISYDSSRKQSAATGSPMNSPRISRRSSSTPRAPCPSPVSSPRISRRKSSTLREPALVNSPAPMRRAISNLSPSPSRAVARSATFGSKEELTKQLKNNCKAKPQSPRQQGSMTGIPRPKGPVKQSKVPIKVPGKQSPAKSTSTTSVRPTKQEPPPPCLQNGSPRKTPIKQDQSHPPQDPFGDIPTPFDNYSYTSEDTSSLISDKDMFLGTTESVEHCRSDDSTPDTIIILDSFMGVTGDRFSTTASDYDYLDCESDVSGIKSPLSISSGYSFGPSPTKELMDSHNCITSTLTEEDGEVANVGISERLKSLNVELSSVRPTLRGKIFTQPEETPQQSNIDMQQESGIFSATEYMQKEPEERSKFFDIEKEFPRDTTDGDEDTNGPSSPRKFSLVHALIGSIERRSEPRPSQRKKKSDSFELIDGTDDKPESNLSALPTQPHPGGEAVTGSCGSTQDCKVDPSPKPSTTRDEAPSDNLTDQQRDENFNLRNDLPDGTKPTSNTTDHEYICVIDDVTEQDNNKNDDTNTGSPKHKQLAMDSYPRVQRQFSLEELIEDMLPSNELGNESGKEPAFQALI